MECRRNGNGLHPGRTEVATGEDWTGLSKLSLCQRSTPPGTFHVYILFMLSIRNTFQLNIWEWFPLLLPPKVYCKSTRKAAQRGLQKLVPRWRSSTELSLRPWRIYDKELSWGWHAWVKGIKEERFFSTLQILHVVRWGGRERKKEKELKTHTQKKKRSLIIVRLSTMPPFHSNYKQTIRRMVRQFSLAPSSFELWQQPPGAWR